MSNTKTNTNKAAAGSENKPTAAQIQKQIEEAQKILERQIDAFRAKNKLIDDLNKFKTVKMQLVNVRENTQGEGELRIIFQAGRYSSDEVLRVNHSVVVHGFMEFISKHIDEKIKALELEIIK